MFRLGYRPAGAEAHRQRSVLCSLSWMTPRKEDMVDGSARVRLKRLSHVPEDESKRLGSTARFADSGRSTVPCDILTAGNRW